jgi:hypothetical protein
MTTHKPKLQSQWIENQVGENNHYKSLLIRKEEEEHDNQPKEE